MKLQFWTSIFLIVGFLGQCIFGAEVNCNLLDDIFNIVEEALEPAGNCSDYKANPSIIQYDVYTIQNPLKPTIYAGNSTNINIKTSKVTKILIHGWGEKSTTSWLTDVAKAYFDTKKDYNVILVDWSIYSGESYPKSVCYVPSVGEAIAQFIINAKLDSKKVHVIGHSLGGQVGGLVGQTLQSISGKNLSRITGLDAAGPLFCFPNLVDKDERLTADDAEFVDAIHTDGSVFGCFPDYGTVDFKPNCGTWQAGCSRDALHVALNDLTIEKIELVVFCSHHRSTTYFIDSIYKYNCFLSQKCNNCLKFSKGHCKNNTEAYMGEYCPKDVSGNYYLFTRSQEPYCNN